MDGTLVIKSDTKSADAVVLPTPAEQHNDNNNTVRLLYYFNLLDVSQVNMNTGSVGWYINKNRSRNEHKRIADVEHSTKLQGAEAV